MYWWLPILIVPHWLEQSTPACPSLQMHLPLSVLQVPWLLQALDPVAVAPGHSFTQPKPQNPALHAVANVRHVRPDWWHVEPQYTDAESVDSGWQPPHVPSLQVPRPLQTCPPKVGQLTLQNAESYPPAQRSHFVPA
jgi:hypothetical protein